MFWKQCCHKIQSYNKGKIWFNRGMNSFTQPSLKDVEIKNKLKPQYPVARWKHAAIIYDVSTFKL